MPENWSIPLWKSSPFVRLLLALIAGILMQWHFPVSLKITGAAFITIFFLLLLIRFLPSSRRYRLQWLQGICIHLLIFLTAVFLTQQKDIRNNRQWFGKYYTNSSTLIIRITEPLLAKERSYKAEGNVESIAVEGSCRKVCGKVILYFSKDDTTVLPEYGDRIMVTGNLRPVKNSGNPGGFDYERYAGFQQIFHQSFLKKENYILLKEHERNFLYRFIFYLRAQVVSTLQRYIRGNKKVTGIAEALLIGYKEDLDKDVVQDYSNTGVVHIIAISGMHLGLIYVVLVWIFSRLPFIKRSAALKVLLILSCLWLFSLITGASASVLRSAVMFTCIVIGKNFFRQAKIYNSLAASAFLLLCYNPYLLWDTGFQLSYFAVVGIVWLQKPIINIFYIRHKFLQTVWEMASITIAAQIITFPICIFYFHQFPNMFLISNLLCVPLSTVILFAEIFLLAFSWIPFVAVIAGKLVYVLTWLMNTIISCCSRLPYSLLDGIYATPLTTVLLYIVVICICGGLVRRNKKILKIAFISGCVFGCVFTYGKLDLYRQRKIIVYNVPRHTAVDFVNRGKYCFYGDDTLTKENPLQNFHLKPSRISMQVNLTRDSLPGLEHIENLWQFGSKKFMLVDSSIAFEPREKKLQLDFILICRSPKIKIADLLTAADPAVIVFDASNSLWKIGQWKKECSALHLRCHSVSEEGAYISDAR